MSLSKMFKALARKKSIAEQFSGDQKQYENTKKKKMIVQNPSFKNM